jgi:class 3 adenylate cyclase
MSHKLSNALTDDYLPWAVDADEVPEDVRTVVLGSREGTHGGRALGAVLFTDIVESTNTIAELGNRRWRDLLEAHNALVRRELVRYGGREVDTAGDGFMATFDGPARAVRCACAIRDAVSSLGLGIRVGVHTGECDVVDGKLAGLAVAVGARVAAHAGVGEVLVSGTVFGTVVGGPFTFEDRGFHELKGVPGRWPMFALGMPGAERRAREAEEEDARSLAGTEGAAL